MIYWCTPKSEEACKTLKTCFEYVLKEPTFCHQGEE